MSMNLSQNSLFLSFFVLVAVLRSVPTNCEDKITESLPPNENPRYLSFIASRMKHLTAINDLKLLANSVKRHQLVVDLSKKVFAILDDSRKKLASSGNQLDFPDNDPMIKFLVNYLENTAFFCDLLVFFPEITARLLEANLLWRVTLIDSIQDAMSFNVNFVDDNTHTQFDKAYKILSEGAVTSTESTREKRPTEAKKPKRKPRMTLNEL